MVNSSVRIAALIAASLAALSFNAAALAQPQPAAKPAPGAAVPGPARAPIDPENAPKITFDKTTHDFGTIPDDKSVDTVFRFTNTGKGTLEIIQAAGSCGCTVPALTKRTYAPGESGEIKVAFNPHNRRDKQHTQVTVTTNDPAAPAQLLHVNSFVKAQVRLDPQALSFGQIEKNKGAGNVVVFTSVKPDLRPISVQSNNPIISAVLEEPKQVTIEGDQALQASIRISIDPNAQVGPFQGAVTLVTSDPTKPMTITVLGEVIGELALVPPRLSIGGTSPNQQVATQVQISSRYAKPFKILKVEEVPAPNGTKMLVFETIEDSTVSPPRTTLKVSGNAPQTNGAFRGEIVVTTDLPGEETVRIPYFGFVRGGQNPVPGGTASPVGVPQDDAWRRNPSSLIP
jgi:hypothetical protein